MMSAFMFPIYLATNKIIYIDIERREYSYRWKTEELGTKRWPAVGPDRPEREAKLTHGNLQISKCLCIIIRSCYKYKC